MSKVPTEPQLEAAFEVLAWLWSRFDGEERGHQREVVYVKNLLKQEVNRCLAE